MESLFENNDLKVYDFKQKALDLIKRNNIEIKLDYFDIEKHPNYDHNYEVHCIRISRKDRSFKVKYGSADLGCDDGEILQGDDLVYRVLVRIPKYEYKSFEEFLLSVGKPENEEQLRLTQKWYESETEDYKNVLMVFSDIIEELRELDLE